MSSWAHIFVNSHCGWSKSSWDCYKELFNYKTRQSVNFFLQDHQEPFWQEESSCLLQVFTGFCPKDSSGFSSWLDMLQVYRSDLGGLSPWLHDKKNFSSPDLQIMIIFTSGNQPQHFCDDYNEKITYKIWRMVDCVVFCSVRGERV